MAVYIINLIANHVARSVKRAIDIFARWCITHYENKQYPQSTIAVLFFIIV